MKKQATFVFLFDSADDAELVASSLFPEVNNTIAKTSVDLLSSGATLTLTVGSTDVCSLRAACNSYLRWIHTAIDVAHRV